MKNQEATPPFQQEEFIQDLRKLMDLIGLSQKEVAHTLGVQTSHINLYFKSKSDIHSAKLILILQHLGLDVPELLKHKINQLEGRRSSTTGVFYHKVRRLKKTSRNSILRLVEQLTS